MKRSCHRTHCAQTALVVFAFVPAVVGHLEFFCASSVFSNQSEFCNKAIIWLGTYAHNAIPDLDPVPGKAIVYRGANPVQEFPFTFEKYCASSTSTTGRFDALAQPPTVTQLADFIRGLTADDCLPGMEAELAGVHPLMDVTCYGSDLKSPIGPDDSARCPSAQFTGGKILGALIPIVLTDVKSVDDLSILVHSTGFEVKKWPGTNDACSVASVETIDEDNATCYMNILNWDGTTCGVESANTLSTSVHPQVEIPGCGGTCGPYTPPTAVANNDCTAVSIPSGTTCNIECAAQLTAVGSPVSCQAGEYIGSISCLDENADLFAWEGDVVPNATAEIPNANLDQIETISGDGCGEWTPIGVTCFITCGFGYYSTGTVTAVNVNGVAGWDPSPDAACVPTQCGFGTAIPEEGVVGLVSGSEVISSGNFMNDASLAIFQPGCNFDPVHDRVVVVPRSEGQMAPCDGSLGPAGGVTFTCNSGGSSDVLLECTPDGPLDYGDLPKWGQICVCDADLEKGCTDPSQFSKQGGVTDTTFAPTAAPSEQPTPLPTHQPTQAPTFAPSFSPTRAPTFPPSFSPTNAPTNAPTHAPTNAPTDAPTKAPTDAPTEAPTESPSFSPTHAPTRTPTHVPTDQPTHFPTNAPSTLPTHNPSFAPTDSPFVPLPAFQQTESPTWVPTATAKKGSKGKGKNAKFKLNSQTAPSFPEPPLPPLQPGGVADGGKKGKKGTKKDKGKLTLGSDTVRGNPGMAPLVGLAMGLVVAAMIILVAIRLRSRRSTRHTRSEYEDLLDEDVEEMRPILG